MVCTDILRTNIIELWYAGFNHKLAVDPSTARKGTEKSFPMLICQAQITVAVSDQKKPVSNFTT